MESICLHTEIIIQDKDFWGRKSQMSFTGGVKGQGWRWLNKNGLVFLNNKKATKGTRQVQFNHRGSSLHVFEHIGFLKWIGLLDVTLESNSWPPYFSRGQELLDLVLKHAEKREEVKWYTPIKEVESKRPGASIKIVPWKEKRLRLNVEIDYPKIGSCRRSFSFPSSENMKEICLAYTQGWPPSLYYLSKTASMFGWPNHKRITWPQEHDPEVLLEKFLFHRAFDLLGGLSVVCKDGLLAADVTSCCCGHRDDLTVLSQIDENLRQI